jgi:hypothetical protein
MACAAIQASVANMNAHIKLPTIQGYGEATALTGVTSNPIGSIVDPPIDSVAPNLEDTTGFAATLKLDGIYFDSTNHLIADVAFLGLQGAGLGQKHMVDSKGHVLGFGFYLSSPVNFVGARPSSQYHSMILATGIINTGTTGIITFHGMRVSADASTFLVGHKNLPTTGQIYLVTLVIYGDNGTMTKLDSFYVKYGTAAPTIPA